MIIKWVIIGIHMLVSIGLILVVLLQTGKGTGMSGVFGGGGGGGGGGASESFFGAAGGGGFFAKMTTVVAIVFMVTCLLLAKLSSVDTNESLMGDSTKTEEKSDSGKKTTKETEADKHKREKRTGGESEKSSDK